MATGVPMSARRFTASAVVALVAAVCFHARAQAPTSSPPPSSLQTQPAGSTSSTPVDQKPVHKKTGPYSSQSVRHPRRAEEGAPPAELTQAEESIQKHDYGTAEPLLRKVVERDPSNYVAWFYLGFVENGLGKIDDSISAYRKSVVAKPDVFESNLNLGLQLAKSGQADAEQFLRAATKLKPTSRTAEGQYRAWLSLGHVLE